MKQVKRSRFTKKQFTALVLSAVFVFLLAISITLALVSKALDKGKKKEPVIPEIIEGEGLYNNYAVAYPTMEQNDIMYVEINGENGAYGLYRPKKGEPIELYYIDTNGKEHVYYPPISALDSTFSYESLYAMENSDGFGTIPRLTYLCSALTRPYFDARIKLSDTETEREKQLSAYGFIEDETTEIFFTYIETKKDADGNVLNDENGNPLTEEKEHTLTIGKKNIADSGYYFMIDGRDYVYSSESTYYDYAMAGFASLVNSTLVAAGLSSDSGFGPYLTQGYYQWLSEKHAEAGAKVPENSRVIVFADTLTAPGATDTDIAEDGYLHTGRVETVLDLSSFIKSGDGYAYAVKALLGKEIGEYADNIVFSILYPAAGEHVVALDEAESVTYSYTVKEILSVMTDGGERSDVGFAVGDNKHIKVRYDLTVGEKTESRLAVLDISSAAIPEDVRAKLAAAAVGTLTEPLCFEVEYNTENTLKRAGKYTISEILSITDKNGKEIDRVTSESKVSYKCAFEIDGEVIYEKTLKIDLSRAEDDEDKKISSALVGKKKGKGLSIIIDEYTAHFEIMMSFETLRISQINYFVTDELVAAFKFQNNSQRDPYYGESLYENLMTNEYSLYGINYTSCQGIVKVLGGISADGSSATANGLSGLETVAVGLTPEVMDQYKLYAHKIYFELPRGIEAYTPDNGEASDEDTIDDYFFYDTIGFTLYISEEDPKDGTRYVGSDMYDVVVKIDGENFFFLDETFESFWARRNIMLMDVEDIESMTVNFGFEDVKGKYKFDLGKNSDGGVTVKVTPDGECTPTELTKLIAENGYSFVSLGELFETKYPNDPEKEEFAPDSVGTTYFKEVLRSIYFVEFEGVLTESEITAARGGACLFRIELKIRSSAYRYVYEFYAVDASRVLVTIHKENSKGEIVLGPVADFYISTFAFKKITKNGFFDLLNAVKVDPEVGYPDEILKK